VCGRVITIKMGILIIYRGSRKAMNYPQAVSSFIYRNDSKGGKIKFTDVTASVAPSLINVGLTCDAIWTDFDNDGWQDLILAGEWMPVKFLKNDKGHFKDVTSSTGISDKSGWWNSIIAGDFDMMAILITWSATWEKFFL